MDEGGHLLGTLQAIDIIMDRNDRFIRATQQPDRICCVRGAGFFITQSKGGFCAGSTSFDPHFVSHLV